jgi:hypothetical protein
LGQQFSQKVCDRVTEERSVNNAEWEEIQKELKYDKGENRRKHSGHHADAQMVYKFGGWIGECPRRFDLTVAQELLRNGIPEFRSTTAERPFRIWAYHDGVIYAARSQDGGLSWHGYPNGQPAKEPPRAILRRLEALAEELGEGARIKQWLKKRWDE